MYVEASLCFFLARVRIAFSIRSVDYVRAFVAQMSDRQFLSFVMLRQQLDAKRSIVSKDVVPGPSKFYATKIGRANSEYTLRLFRIEILI